MAFSFPTLVAGLSNMVAGRARGQMAGEQDARLKRQSAMQEALARAGLEDEGITLDEATGQYTRDPTQTAAARQEREEERSQRRLWASIKGRYSEQTGQDLPYVPGQDYGSIQSALAQHDLTTSMDRKALERRFDAGVRANVYKEADRESFLASGGQVVPSEVVADRSRQATADSLAQERAAAQRAELARETTEREKAAAEEMVFEAEDAAAAWLQRQAQIGGEVPTPRQLLERIRAEYPQLQPPQVREIVERLLMEPGQSLQEFWGPEITEAPVDIGAAGGAGGGGGGGGAGGAGDVAQPNRLDAALEILRGRGRPPSRNPATPTNSSLLTR
jgi:hypothetical protein